MQDCRDTFLSYLAANLPGITIHPIRQDPDHPENQVIQMNSVNVEFLNSSFSVFVSKQYVAIDVAMDLERDALATATAVAALLQTNASIPKNHYTVDQATHETVVTPVGTSIWWNPNAVNFKDIQTDGAYFRFNCLLTLQHHLSNLN